MVHMPGRNQSIQMLESKYEKDQEKLSSGAISMVTFQGRLNMKKKELEKYNAAAASSPVPFKWLCDDLGDDMGLLDSSAEGNLEHWSLMEHQLRNEWKIIITDSLAPNAFVHGMLPRRVFINVGLLNHFCKNDDELAAVLGHELSHVLLCHSENRMIINLLQSVVTAAIISVLDFTGLFGLIFEIGAFGKLLQWQNASYSRTNETEADQLGEYIATTACYQPSGAVQVWENATVFEKVVNNGEARVAGFLDSHPLSTERATHMEKNLLPTLLQLYDKCNCYKKARKTQEWGRVTARSNDLPMFVTPKNEK